MMKKLAVLAAILPVAAFAQGAGPGFGPGSGGCANCAKRGGPGDDAQAERMEKRARLARNLGLAEALDLDTAAANKLAGALEKLDDKRVALHKQHRDARIVLRKAAGGEKVSAAEVDAALAKALDAQAQMAALDKETLAIVTKDLTGEKKARAALFLGRFEHKMGPGGMGPGKGRGGRGMGPGGGPGMGPGGHQHGPGCQDCPWDDDK
jgi:hypothetical protein